MPNAQLEHGWSGKETARSDYRVVFPQVRDTDIPQDQEYCLVRVEGGERRIRFHDYHEIYELPGLYEAIFYDRLECQSPALLGMLLAHEVKRQRGRMEHLNVLDVGAGNGIMGEVLAAAGVSRLVGVDILREAARAAERDRPGLYDAYHAVDLLAMPGEVQQALARRRFNCLTLVAALGFGDIPPEVFTVAYNLIEDGGFIAFNLKEEFLQGRDPSGFSRLLKEMEDKGWLGAYLKVRYVHRLSITGEPLFYTGIIGRKHAAIPAGSVYA